MVKEVVGLGPGRGRPAHGDVIVEVNRQPTPHESDYRKVLAALQDGQVAWLFVYRPRPEATFLAKVEVEKQPGPEGREKGTAMSPKPKVLVVDDEEAIRSSLRMIFEYDPPGYECLLAANGQAAIKMVEREAPDLVFLDIKMPQMDGMEVLKASSPSRTRRPSSSSPATARWPPRWRPPRPAPTTSSRSRPTASASCSSRATRSASASSARRTAASSSASTSATRWKGRARPCRRSGTPCAAPPPPTPPCSSPGESGVGKELVARAIHRNSNRRDEAFIQVNCAAIPEELIESELFGHEKGSFTGATEKQIGKFELAHKGTIFLDEVGDMSLRTQAKVLRVLQEGEVERIGSQKTVTRGRARHRRHQQGPRAGHRAGRLPRGPLLPPQRHPHQRARRCASGARTSGRWCATS